MFYIDDIADSAQVRIEANKYVLIQFREGMVWNEFMEEYYMEKRDLKGMSGEDKLVALYEASKDYSPKYPESSLDQMLASKTGVVREAWGAV